MVLHDGTIEFQGTRERTARGARRDPYLQRVPLQNAAALVARAIGTV